MTEKELRHEIDTYFSDVEFTYKEIRGLIFPEDIQKITLLYADREAKCNSLDELMDCRLIEGIRFGDLVGKIRF